MYFSPKKGLLLNKCYFYEVKVDIFSVIFKINKEQKSYPSFTKSLRRLSRLTFSQQRVSDMKTVGIQHVSFC